MEIEVQLGTPKVRIKRLECHLTYVHNTSPERKKNFWCALHVNFRSATHICKMVTAHLYLALRRFTELPELNSSKHFLYLVQFSVLIMLLAL